MLELDDVLVVQRLVDLDLADELRYDSFYLLLGSTAVQRRLGDDFGRQYLFVFEVGYLVALRETAAPQDLATIVFLDRDLTIDLGDLLLDHGWFIGGFLVVPGLLTILLGLASRFFHPFSKKILLLRPSFSYLGH